MRKKPLSTELIDQLVHTYNKEGRLTRVEDNAPTGDRDYGFRPGSISSGGRAGQRFDLMVSG